MPNISLWCCKPGSDINIIRPFTAFLCVKNSREGKCVTGARCADQPLWRSLVRSKARWLILHTCLNSGSELYFNTGLGSGSRDGGESGGSGKVKSTVTHMGHKTASLSVGQSAGVCDSGPIILWQQGRMPQRFTLCTPSLHVASRLLSLHPVTTWCASP